ncbi:hypothetical protein ANN_01761 [Periplaneta americana]|uniref:Uncharacterized protein n=1 Tax=Periplaneta americana TaxID=6978 RepID=A0ABQ8TUF3_PERAM|nr:hypothetical protein ANN_01761 [Periplaneta americana]
MIRHMMIGSSLSNLHADTSAGLDNEEPIICQKENLRPIIEKLGSFLGAPCELTCDSDLPHVFCDQITRHCECEKKYPVKLGAKKGCAKHWLVNMREPNREDYKEYSVETMQNVTAKMIQDKYYIEHNHEFNEFSDIAFKSVRDVRNNLLKENNKYHKNRGRNQAASDLDISPAILQHLSYQSIFQEIFYPVIVPQAYIIILTTNMCDGHSRILIRVGYIRCKPKCTEETEDTNEDKVAQDMNDLGVKDQIDLEMNTNDRWWQCSSRGEGGRGYAIVVLFEKAIGGSGKEVGMVFVVENMVWW